MQWFHHDSTARFSPAVHELGLTLGAEGIGVFWSLLEAIAHHSDTFCMKVTGISEEVDRAFEDLRAEIPAIDSDLLRLTSDFSQIPKISVGVLAKSVFTTRRKLSRIIESLASLGLVDAQKWRNYGVISSPYLVRCAEGYLHRHPGRRRALPPVPGDVENGVIHNATDAGREEKRKEQRRTPLVHTARVGYPQSVGQSDVLRALAEGRGNVAGGSCGTPPSLRGRGPAP